jgi:parallel beta helix pectate lyase-like protein
MRHPNQPMTHRQSLPFLLFAFMLAILAVAPVGARTALAAPRTNPIVVVNDGGDDATCSGFVNLRCAISMANATPFTDIRFAPNILAVLLHSALPLITGDGTWIDGSDSIGNYVGPRIDGTAWGILGSPAGNAFTINATNVTISNLTIVGIPSGGADVRIQGGRDARIVGNYLGIRPGANQCTSDTDYGVLLDPNTSGGPDPTGVAYIYGNTISCHASRGIWDYGANNVGIGVDDAGHTFGNKIGVSSDGAHAAGNFAGIEVEGNDLKIRGNLVAHNAGTGIRLAFGASNNDVAFNVVTNNGGSGIWTGSGSGNDLIGNDIGTNAGGIAVLSNAQEGILISAGTGLFLSDNIVAYNGLAGIAVKGDGTQAQMRRHSVRSP